MGHDRALMEKYLAYLMGHSLYKAKRGDVMDAYRRIALKFGVAESTPRMWISRDAIPRHIHRQILADLEGQVPETAVEDLTLDPAVLTVARDIQKLYQMTHGRGELWKSLIATVQLAITFAKQQTPRSMRHLRPLAR